MIGSGIAYLFFFRVVRDWGAMRASLVTYLVPVVGIVMGIAFLGETLEPSELAGAALIISGVVLANSRFGRRRLLGSARRPPDAQPPARRASRVTRNVAMAVVKGTARTMPRLPTSVRTISTATSSLLSVRAEGCWMTVNSTSSGRLAPT